VYSFNPLQAQKEVKVGNYYYKKGSYRSAAQRFLEATKWNPNYAEAWLRLGEAAEKQNDEKTAVQAFSKYLELQPEAKEAPVVKKKLEKLKHS
jgi:tetratricopeptide (TPR) repeat protein